MAGLIKNQILKHLSKFTKNLSPDKISLSAMKGEGDLSNLELDEAVLTDLLALPSWIRLKKATCNKVNIKIQWTKLNSQPIFLYLDEVIVEMETCDVPRTPTSAAAPVNSYNKGGKYGFAEQIIDGMYLSINSIIVNFRSNKFNASIQVSRILVQSKTPKWQDGDLFMTRLKNDLIGEVMIFKEAEWQTLRIEANALDTGDPLLATTPLRLIANQSKIRITIKKKISDCSIVSSRLQVNLDDLLWVLTDSQLTAAMTFAAALQETIAKAKEASVRPNVVEPTKAHASVSSSSIPSASSTQPAQTSTSPQHPMQAAGRQAPAPTKIGSKTQQQKAKIFDMHNIMETSYHLYTGRIDLHLCDDVSPEESNYQRKVEGGAIQLVLYHLEFDIYPYHRAGESRTRWPKYEENMKQRDSWASDILKAFTDDVRTVRETFRASTNPASVVSIPTDGVVLRPNASVKTGSIRGNDYVYLKDGRPVLKAQQADLLESCVVVRVEDFALFRVSTALDSKRSTPKKFISSDKKLLRLPPEMSSVHVVFTDYYFPEGVDSPGGTIRIAGGSQKGFLVTNQFGDLFHIKELVPHANLFIVVNPICVAVDYLTLLWMNVFSLNLAKKAEEIPRKPPSKLHTDIRLEALMPRVIVPQTDVTGMQGRPGDLDGLQLQMSKVIVTNCRLTDTQASRSGLKSTLNSFNSSQLFSRGKSPEFPNESDDCAAIAERFYNHVLRKDDGYEDVFIEDILRLREMDTKQPLEQFAEEQAPISNPKASPYLNMATDSFRLNVSKDVWCVVVDQVWLEFTIVKTSSARIARTLPLMESFPLVVWLYELPSEVKTGKDSTCDSTSESKGKVSTDEASNHEASNHEAKNHEAKDLPVASLPQTESSNADTYVLMKIDVKIQFQIDHERYWFLMNLLETVTRCSEEMEADLKNITGKIVTPKRAVLSVIVREVEVALLFPPSRDLSSQVTSPDDVGNSSGLMSDGLLDNVGSQTTLSEDGLQDQTLRPVSSSLSCDPLTVPEISLPSVSPTPESSSLMYYDDVSQRYSPIEIANDAMSMLDEQDESRVVMNNGVASFSLSGSRSQSPEPGLNHHNSTNIPRSLSRDSTSFPGSKKPPDIKKSFNQAFSSLTAKLTGPRTSMRRANPRSDDTASLDAWDSISVTSGSLSDEDEEYALEKIESQAERPAFERKTMITDDSSTMEEGSDYSRDDDTSSNFTATLNKKVVSVFTVNIGNIEAVLESRAKEMSAKAIVGNIGMAEGGNMEMEKFMSLFTSGNKDYTDWVPSVSRPIVRARFDLGAKAEQLAPTAGEKGFIRALVEGIRVKLLASTLKSVSELFEDNKPSPPNFLMEASLSDIAVTFVDDKMPMYLPEPKNATIDLLLQRIVIKRGQDGIFRIGDSAPASVSEKTSPPPALITEEPVKADSKSPPHVNGLKMVTSDKSTEVDTRFTGRPTLESENDLLRRQLEKIGKMACCRMECSELRTKCEALEKVEVENGELRREMEHQMKELLSLKEEREALLTVVQKLQDDLSYSERMRSRPMNH